MPCQRWRENERRATVIAKTRIRVPSHVHSSTSISMSKIVGQKTMTQQCRLKDICTDTHWRDDLKRSRKKIAGTFPNRECLLTHQNKRFFPPSMLTTQMEEKTIRNPSGTHYGLWNSWQDVSPMEHSMWQMPGQIHSLHPFTNGYRHYGKMGNTASKSKISLFQDPHFACDLADSKSTSGNVLCTLGSHTFVLISWTCPKSKQLSHPAVPQHK